MGTAGCTAITQVSSAQPESGLSLHSRIAETSFTLGDTVLNGEVRRKKEADDIYEAL